MFAVKSIITEKERSGRCVHTVEGEFWQRPPDSGPRQLRTLAGAASERIRWEEASPGLNVEKGRGQRAQNPENFGCKEAGGRRPIEERLKHNYMLTGKLL